MHAFCQSPAIPSSIAATQARAIPQIRWLVTEGTEGIRIEEE